MRPFRAPARPFDDRSERRIDEQCILNGVKRFIVGDVQEVFGKNNGFGKSEKFPFIHLATILLNRMYFNRIGYYTKKTKKSVSITLRRCENHSLRHKIRRAFYSVLETILSEAAVL